MDLTYNSGKIEPKSSPFSVKGVSAVKKSEKNRYLQTPVTYDTPFKLSDYSILKKIPFRGSSELFLARRLPDDRFVLIKKSVMPPGQKDYFLEYFQNEVRNTAALSNSTVVPIIEYGINANSFYLATALVNGCDFSALISSNAFDRPLGLMVLTEGLQALHSAHTKGIAHCNFTPSSLQIDQSGRVYLTNFGSSQQLGRQSAYSYFATPLFMPPEQALLVSEQTRYTENQFSDSLLIHYKNGLTPTEIRTLTERTIQWDIWSAGVQLYLVCSGVYPFYTPVYSELLKTIVYGDPPSIIHIAPDVPRAVASVIKQCLQKEPYLRPQSLDPVINVLQEYFFSLGISTFKGIIKQNLKNRPDTLFFSPEYNLTQRNGSVSQASNHVENHAAVAANKETLLSEGNQSHEIQLTCRQKFRIESGWEFFEHKTLRHYPPQTSQIPGKIIQFISYPFRLPQILLDGIQSSGPIVKAYVLKLLPVLIALFTLAIVIIPGTIIGKKLAKRQGKQTALSVLKKKIIQSTSATNEDTSQEIELAFYAPLNPVESRQGTTSGLQKKATPSKSNTSGRPATTDNLTVNASQPIPPIIKEPQSAAKNQQTKRKSPVRAASKNKTAKRSITETAVTNAVTPPEPSPGILKISVDPSDAHVYIDGARMSMDQIENGKKMSAGSYTVTANSSGFKPYSKTVRIETDKTVILSIALKQEIKGNGQLHVFSYPWASLYIDGELKGTAPTAVPVVLPEGSHKLVLKRNGYQPYTKDVTMKTGEVVRLQIQLEK